MIVGHALAHRLVGVRGLLAEEVHAAVDVCVLTRVVAGEAVDHRLGLLRGGRVVEVDKRLVVVEVLLERRERGAHRFDVVVGIEDRFLFRARGFHRGRGV
jgi:hypothetical protein